jgi:hypothetical protein
MDELLQPGETVVIPATAPFAVSANFRPDMTPETRVHIASVLPNFVRWFFDKNESAAPSSMMEWFELQRSGSNSTILQKLGGAAMAETTLASAYWLMLQQNAGQAGPLAANGWGNVFYARDATGELRSVNIHWCDGGWSVDALQINAAAEWPIRDRVFRPKG